MAVWTPAPAIRVKVLGLAWRGEDLLLAEVEDSWNRVKGLRPLGGCVEFGETREAALAREFREELGCAVERTGPWHAFENLYEHEGATGHEYLFAADIVLGEPSLYAKDRIPFLEDNGLGCTALWARPGRLPEGVELYPAALLRLIEARAVGRG
jgi:8-oxo-dGTP pyrophosphatase MutT (NUDIX family)